MCRPGERVVGLQNGTPLLATMPINGGCVPRNILKFSDRAKNLFQSAGLHSAVVYGCGEETLAHVPNRRTEPHLIDPWRRVSWFVRSDFFRPLLRCFPKCRRHRSRMQS